MEIRRDCFKSKAEKMKAVRKALRKYGDDLPESVMRKSTSISEADNWIVFCDEHGNILAAGKAEKTDWYEVTLKNAFVVPRARGKKVGTTLYKLLMKKAREMDAKVVVADITADNVASKLAAQRAGMHSVSAFKWAKGETHADIMHKIIRPPRRREVLSINAKITAGFQKRNKPVPEGILSPMPRKYKQKKDGFGLGGVMDKKLKLGTGFSRKNSMFSNLKLDKKKKLKISF